jgi:Zn-dependent protease/CBS domain-containing protein
MARSGFGIGRIFGINIRIDWSWLLIFFLVTWQLGTAFGQFHQDWSVVLTWGTAVAAALLFFGSVLAHELAHSLVARARGIPIRSITLFLFGGVSNIQQEPETPQGEFLMAILGPVTSLVIGGVLLGIVSVALGPAGYTGGNLGELIGQLSAVSTILLWLGTINISLGVFNLIPGFPLDGGRVLRSILWAAVDDLRRATRWASWVGQGIAWIMIISGIAMIFGVQFPVLGGGFINGLWLAFIGWFLNSASSRSYQQVVIQDILEGVPISRMMRSSPPTCSSRCSVSTLVNEHIMQSDSSVFPVVDDGQLSGIVTLEDVRSVSRDQWDAKSVSDIMTPRSELTTVGPDEDASDAWEKLTGVDVQQLPVVSDGDELVGTLRRQDIIKWLQVHSELGG